MIGAPSVSPVDEFRCDQKDGDEAELGVAVFVAAVRVPAELPVVRKPRVGALNDPSQPEPHRLFLDCSVFKEDHSWTGKLKISGEDWNGACGE